MGDKNYLLLFSLRYEKPVYNLVLVQTHTSKQAPTYRRLQPSLVLQLLLEGSYNPLALVLANIYLLVRRHRPTEGYNLLFSSRDDVS